MVAWSSSFRAPDTFKNRALRIGICPAAIGILEGVEVTGGQHAGIGDDHDVVDAVTRLEGVQHRDQGGGLCLVAFEQVHLERHPGLVDEQPDLDLRVHAMLLGHPHPPQGVLVVVLEVQGRHVVHHKRRRPGRVQRVRQAGARDLVAVAALVGTLERRVDRLLVRGLNSEVLEHPDRVDLRRRLDEARQHELHEHLVVDDVEAQPLVRVGEDLPQQRTRGLHDAGTALPVHDLALEVEIQFALTCVEFLASDLHQYRQFGLAMR